MCKKSAFQDGKLEKVFLVHFRLKKITVPSDCWGKSYLFLRNFSLQKDYSSKWVGEKFPSFFEKISKIRSHSVKKIFFGQSKP